MEGVCGSASGGRALVLGGGGIAGSAWMTGLLLGLERMGLHLRRADLVVGTSAGSVVGAQLAGGTSLSDLCDSQRAGASGGPVVRLGAGAVTRIAASKLTLDKAAGLRRLGRQVARRSNPDLAVGRRAVLAGRLPEHAWPDADLKVTAVNINTGRLEVFDRDGSVELVDAVTASCAVPFVWPPVHLGSHRYMDGGMWSGVNAHLAAGRDRVIVIAPIPFGARREMRGFGSHTEKLLITPDRASRSTWGVNPLDPATAPAATDAGIAQAPRVADVVREAWEG
ncbi:patatin-like phospholipase family protein [Nocardia grenadensis]|uniref:patatin-like phospholipase family protein n=1 Tax=Nocardia grenadensis TaxID=931537 RepID=UPI000A0333FF|nr:patatin-like phospholipase family protein [Nocardia grenadensis]